MDPFDFGSTSRKGKNRGRTNGKTTGPDRRKSKSFGDRKEHDTKGRDNHGRTRR